MNQPRTKAAAVVWKGKIIICGGLRKDNDLLKSVECYDPESGVWSEFDEMPTPRINHSLISHESKLILLGGFNGKEAVASVLELENPLEGNGRWKQLSTIKISCSWFAGLALDSALFVIGGDNDRDGKFFGPFLPYRCLHPSAVLIPQHFVDLLSSQ